METYLIKYQLVLNENILIKDKEIKVKNCRSELHAKIKLEEYLKQKHSNFKQLIIDSCSKDFNLSNIFKDGRFNFGKFI